jgi:hypothetical protein
MQVPPLRACMAAAYHRPIAPGLPQLQVAGLAKAQAETQVQAQEKELGPSHEAVEQARAARAQPHPVERPR